MSMVCALFCLISIQRGNHTESLTTTLMTNTQICFFFSFSNRQNAISWSATIPREPPGDAHSHWAASFLRRTEPLRTELHAQSCRESHITTATGAHTESPSASASSEPIHRRAESTENHSKFIFSSLQWRLCDCGGFLVYFYVATCLRVNK